jgi:hypothetical protein
VPAPVVIVTDTATPASGSPREFLTTNVGVGETTVPTVRPGATGNEVSIETGVVALVGSSLQETRAKVETALVSAAKTDLTNRRPATTEYSPGIEPHWQRLRAA